MPREFNRLVVHAGGDLRTCGKQHLDLMLGAVGGVRGPRHIGHGTREQVHVVEKRWCEESEVDLNTGSGEAVPCMGRGEAHGGLLHRRHAAGISSHDPEGLAVHPHKAFQRLRVSGPVPRWRVGQLVRIGSDAEIGIVRDERRGGRTLALLGNRGDCGEEDEEQRKA